MSSIRIYQNSPKLFGTSFQYTNDDVALAAAKIGLDYVQLWRHRIPERKIMIQKLEEIFQRHQRIYYNKINEAIHVSWIIYKAALSNL